VNFVLVLEDYCCQRRNGSRLMLSDPPMLYFGLHLECMWVFMHSHLPITTVNGFLLRAGILQLPTVVIVALIEVYMF
jgi:hypothetical protein